MTQRIWVKPEPDLDAVEDHYSLNPREWTGSLTDKVSRIMRKNSRYRDEYVNALLRDEAYMLTEGVNFCRDIQYSNNPALIEQSVSEEIDLICYDGSDLRSAVEEASWNGVVFTKDTFDALRRAHGAHTDVLRDAEWYLSEGEEKTDIVETLDDARSTFGQTCDEARKASETRLYYRGIEEAKQRDRQQHHMTETSREPVLVGDVIKDWMHSIGRDELGRPINQTNDSKERDNTASVAAVVHPQPEQRLTRAADRWSDLTETTTPDVDDEFEL